MNCVRNLVFAVVSLTAFCGFNSSYPFTAEQAGVIAMQLRGRQIAIALIAFHNENDRWPQALSELVPAGLATTEQLLYPKTYDLVDRRDLLKIPDHVEWLYIRPRDGLPGVPLLMAPLPVTSSMGKRLKEPKRIVVRADATVETLSEHEITTIIRRLAGT